MTAPSLSTGELTQLLVAWGDGYQAALDKLMPLVHEELRQFGEEKGNR